MIACAIVGLGRWGRALVEAARDEPRLRITRAVEPDAAGAAAFCRSHDLDLAAGFHDVLADRAVDAVLLATPHSLHKAQVLEAAAAGKQIFCEKPLALRRDDAAAMFAAAREAGVMLAVGHNRRFWPSMQALRALVAGGDLGTVLHAEGHYSNEFSQIVTQGWRLSPQESPGGGLTGGGLHVLDAFVSLLGPVRQVYARLLAREAGPPPLDTAIMALDFVSGASGLLATVRATPMFWRIHVFGTKGSAEVLDERTMVVRWSGAPPVTKTYAADRPLTAELSAFAEAIERREPFPVPEADVLATLAGFEAALQSMQGDRPVVCPV